MTKKIIFSLLSALVFLVNSAQAQCTLEAVIPSTDGYNVHVEMRLEQLIKPSACPNGYNFNIRYSYDIWFSGSNIPSGLWTLQGNIICGQYNDNFLDLPNSGGSGTNVSGGNSWRDIADCETATISSLLCNRVDLTIQGPGISYRTIPLECAISLPIELVDFDAAPGTDHVALSWRTATESNNSRFDIEKSTDGDNWTVIGTLEGAGTKNTPTNYSWIDYSRNTSSTIYYRLKQTDYDGQFSYSWIRSTTVATPEFSVYPNPTNGMVSVSSESSVSVDDIRVLDAHGRTIPVELISESENRVKLDLSTAQPGIYFLQYDTNTYKIIRE